MATIPNKRGVPARNEDPVYAVGSDSGDSLLPAVNISGVDVLQLNRVGIGITNYSGADVTCVVVPTTNDVANTMTVTIPDGTRWSDAKFNAVVVAGSTGHDGSGVYYLYE